MSDHGDLLGDHGLMHKGCRSYEGLVRVPLIVSWPERVSTGPGHALVELTDVAPTLLEAANLPIPDWMKGRSLLPLMSDPSAVHRDSVRCEYYHTLNPEGGSHIHGASATMIRDRRHKLSVYHGHEMGELFDLDRGAEEFTNRWDDSDYVEVRFDLLKRSFDALAFAVDFGSPQVCQFLEASVQSSGFRNERRPLRRHSKGGLQGDAISCLILRVLSVLCGRAFQS